MKDSVLFSRVMEEYGSREHGKSDQASLQETLVEPKAKDANQGKPTTTDKLIQDEERLVGAVSGTVYKRYFKYAGGYSRLFVILVLLVAFQGAQGTYLASFYVAVPYAETEIVSGQHNLPWAVDTAKSRWVYAS